MRPSTHAAISAQTRILQNRTAGPRRGPFAQRIQRFPARVRKVLRFALSTGNRTSSAVARKPSGALIFHPMEIDCSPGRNGMITLVPSLRTGDRFAVVRERGDLRVRGKVHEKILAKTAPQREIEFGNALAFAERDLMRAAEDQCTVAPAMASGRLTVSSTPSPGHGCHTGMSSGISRLEGGRKA